MQAEGLGGSTRTAENKRDRQRIERAQAWTDRMDLIPSVGERLLKIESSLGKLWRRCFGEVERAGKFSNHLEVYLGLFRQVSFPMIHSILLLMV